jgi:hypothetical protein
MLRLSRPTIALFLGVALLNALHGWALVAEQAGYTAPPAVSRLLLRDVLERRAAVLANLDGARGRQRGAQELAAAVAQGRLTLYEGAARLRDLYRGAPDFPWQAVERRFPGASDEERCCRLLLGEIRSLEGPDREQAQAVALRLEAELEDELRRGTLSLPGHPPQSGRWPPQRVAAAARSGRGSMTCRSSVCRATRCAGGACLKAAGSAGRPVTSRTSTHSV